MDFPGINTAQSWRVAALIAMIAFQLRSIVVGVPPALPDLRDELHLSFSATGTLAALPLLGFGTAAVPGALLVNRFGARKVVGLATLGCSLAALLRLSPPLPYSLFVWTAILSLSIATAQPAMTVLVRNWFPGHIQQMATTYVMSLTIGGLAGATLSVYILAFAGWRGTFITWGLLALMAAIVWIGLAPGRHTRHVPIPHGLGQLIRSLEVWHVAALFSGQSVVFYGAITWIPFLLHSYSRAYLALVLFLLQIAALPLAAVLATVRRSWATSRIWYATGGLLMAVGSLGLMLGITNLAWIWAPILGLGNMMSFAGTSALPAIVAGNPSRVAGYSALTLTVGYAFAFLGPLLGGLLLDHTQIITSPFWVTTVAAIMATVLGATLPRPRLGRASASNVRLH